jgi:hypothetical protein
VDGDGCEAAVFTAAARHRWELAAVDSGGSAKLAEAAAHAAHYVAQEAGGLVAGPGEDGFVGKQRHGRAP